MQLSLYATFVQGIKNNTNYRLITFALAPNGVPCADDRCFVFYDSAVACDGVTPIDLQIIDIDQAVITYCSNPVNDVCSDLCVIAHHLPAPYGFAQLGW